MRNAPAQMEVICGPMFCGKTEELIRRLKRAVIAKNKVQVFKPVIDNRYVLDKVHSHSGNEFEAFPISEITEIYQYLDDETSVVGIDEAQFFDEKIFAVVETLLDKGIRVILAGLDLDFRGEPFGVMPQLMALAERVDKLSAICMVCGELASRTQRLINGVPANYDEPLIVVGTAELYEARCRRCHVVPGKPKR